MDKVQRPRGLVRYATENAMEYGWTSAQMLRRVFRPRVLIYTALLWSLIGVVGLSLWLRTPLHVDVERDRSSLARIVKGGRIENVYRLQVMNASEAVDHVHIRVSGIEGLTLASDADFVVDKAQSRWVPVRVQLPYDGASPGSHGIVFEITEPDSGAQVMEKAVFLVPR
jgi:polyferredoxin